ncbi:MAG: PIN domain nuclease [bacterium]|nr:PIN domain nuclease [bacterium]
MTVRIVRGFFILACVIMGTIWGSYIAAGLGENRIAWSLLGGILGAVVSTVLILMLKFISQDLFRKMSPAMVAIALAMMIGWFLGQYVMIWLPRVFPESSLVDDPNLKLFITTSLVLLFGFVGISLGLTYATSLESMIKAFDRHRFDRDNPKIIDTSVLIDGRIADVCDTGFVEGTLLIPRFVLKELQNIADSADVLRRVRGRRGLDIVKALQDPASRVTIKVIEDDPEDIPEVDGKLVRLGKDFKAKILTNDLNLNKVAQIDGVQVLNLNDLANALKPAVLPDEQMHVKIVKEGKEAFQGVGYLDDGTMVVVDGGKDYLGKDVIVLVTSVLQTSAGRMIFTKLQSIKS